MVQNRDFQTTIFLDKRARELKFRQIINIKNFTQVLQQQIKNNNNQSQDIVMQSFHCYICTLNIVNKTLFMADCPVYQNATDSISIESKRVCQNCKATLQNIQKYSFQNQLQFSNHQLKNSVIQMLPACSLQDIKIDWSLLQVQNKHERSRSNSDTAVIPNIKSFKNGKTEQNQIFPPYVLFLLEEVKKKSLFSLYQLPKYLQYLIFLSSKSNKLTNKNHSLTTIISPEQRREKIKSIIFFLIQKIALSIEELPFVLIIINFLLCHMDQQKACSVLLELSNYQILIPEVLNWEILLDPKQQFKNLELKNHNIRFDLLWSRIQGFLKMKDENQALMCDSVRRFGLIDTNLSFHQYTKKINETIKSLKTGRIAKPFKKCEQDIELLYLLKRQKNSYSLILLKAADDQQNLNRRISLLQNKFKKEKQQFINKIVKLNKKIQQLQKQLESFKSKEVISLDFGKKEQQEFIVDSPDKLTENSSNLQNEDTLTYLQNIITITDLINFASKYSEKKQSCDTFTIFSDSSKLAQNIIQNVQRIEQACERLLSKNKIIEQQKNRLLSIIARKQDRLLGVIMQKDVIIERYENALWKMENGLDVIEQPLAHRINYIMQIMSKRKTVDDQMTTTKPKKKKHTSSFIETSNSERPTDHQQKQKQKCQIY